MKKLIFLLILLSAIPTFATQSIPQKYPAKFNKLHSLVKRNYSKKELIELFKKENVVKMDKQTERNLRFILTPLSLKKQKAQHEDFVPKLVNDKTVAKGVKFFNKYKKTFEAVDKKYKVHPADIIAIINWESKLGELTGTQKIIQIFIGQYFLWDYYIKQFESEGIFKKQGAMKKADAVKRAKRLEKNALGNLAALLNQAKKKKFDPAQVLGSWAGAIGYPQFMPASMRFAVDGNGDNKIDLFQMEDAIFSVANYLIKHKYKEKGSEYSFRRYNPDKVYVRGVKMYSDMAKKAGVKIDCDPKASAVCPIEF
jgi:membrane-bound lytic murein transglycosylase B